MTDEHTPVDEILLKLLSDWDEKGKCRAKTEDDAFESYLVWERMVFQAVKDAKTRNLDRQETGRLARKLAIVEEECGIHSLTTTAALKALGECPTELEAKASVFAYHLAIDEAHPIRAKMVRPPRKAEKLLYMLLPKELRNALTGDLEEEFRTLIVPRFGISYAHKWYWAQVLQSLAPLWGRRIVKLVGLGWLGKAAHWFVGKLGS